MSAEKLLPCPFCGGTNTDPEGWMGEHWVSCGTCDASARMTGTLKTACEAWNRRTHPAPIKPSGDTGELRERVAEAKEWIDEAECRRGCSTWRPDVHGRSRCDCGREDALNAILDLIRKD